MHAFRRPSPLNRLVATAGVLALLAGLVFNVHAFAIAHAPHHGDPVTLDSHADHHAACCDTDAGETLPDPASVHAGCCDAAVCGPGGVVPAVGPLAVAALARGQAAPAPDPSRLSGRHPSPPLRPPR